MNRLARWLSLTVLIAYQSFAQFDTADVVGTIRDGSGGAIAAATVTLQNTDTGIATTVKSAENGEYTFVNVRTGSYAVSAEATGFSKAIASGIHLSVGARQRVDLVLQLGAVNERIEVNAAAATIETDSSSRGQVINTTQVVELPLNGRNASDLSLLTTGVLRAPQSTREGSFNVNGLRSVFSNYLLDGIDNNAYGTSNNGQSNQAIQLSPDAIVEFKVETNNYSAEFGRGGSQTTNVVMKAGTNSFHGSAYEFNRNTVFNAVGYFKPLGGVKPPLHQNQFGFTGGGPIAKNRIFFFTDYEGFRIKQGTLVYASIPSANETQRILPVPVENPLTGAIYPANQPIPASAVQPYALKILSQFPAATTSGSVANNFQELQAAKTYSDKFDIKLDDQISPKMSGFVRVSQRKLNGFTNPLVPGLNYNQGSFTHVLNQQAVAGYVWTISPTSILEPRFAITRTDAGGGPAIVGGVNALEGYGIPGLPTGPNFVGGFNIGGGGLPSMTLSPPFTALGRGTATPQFQNPLDFDSKVNFTKIVGRHTIKVGYEWVVLREQVLDINPFYGKYSFLGSFSQPAGTPANARAYSLADFMFGPVKPICAFQFFHAELPQALLLHLCAGRLPSLVDTYPQPWPSMGIWLALVRARQQDVQL
ncbi:MAG: carboxypeptidase regulatory-like domain-containing protein [Acidobacteriia bacterium]|nr:carboxypeptidase regulatory-like domain-containing protein [Terriglobia bacterium]